MMLFWLVAGAMVLIAVVIVLVPLRQPSVEATDIPTESTAVARFRERLAELEHDQQANHLDSALYRSLRTELERQLLADTDQTSSGSPSLARFIGRLATGAAVSVPLLALLYYLALYQGDVQQWFATQQQFDPLVTQALSQSHELPMEAVKDLPNFTRVLQRRLAQQGLQNTDGLYLLGRCYLALQQPQAARLALARAHQYDSQRLDIALVYAQALLLTEEGRLNATSTALLQTVLQQQPNNERALMLWGLGAFQTGAYADAIQAWQTLLDLRPMDSESAKLLRHSITRAQAALAALHPVKGAQAVVADQNQSAHDTLTSQENNNELANAVTGPQLSVTVHLDPHLQTQWADPHTLFIYAKAVHGPPMPVAAIRQPVTTPSTFPIHVVLDDSQAMMPTLKLSSVNEVIVGARLSKANEAVAQPGDLQGISAPIALTAGRQAVTLTIDQQVQ